MGSRAVGGPAVRRGGAQVVGGPRGGARPLRPVPATPAPGADPPSARPDARGGQGHGEPIAARSSASATGRRKGAGGRCLRPS